MKAHTVLEIEIGAVGEEDGHSAEINDKLYSTPADGVRVAERRWGWVNTAVIWPRSPSATCMAHTSRA